MLFSPTLFYQKNVRNGSVIGREEIRLEPPAWNNPFRVHMDKLWSEEFRNRERTRTRATATVDVTRAFVTSSRTVKWPSGRVQAPIRLQEEHRFLVPHDWQCYQPMKSHFDPPIAGMSFEYRGNQSSAPTSGGKSEAFVSCNYTPLAPRFWGKKYIYR